MPWSRVSYADSAGKPAAEGCPGEAAAAAAVAAVGRGDGSVEAAEASCLGNPAGLVLGLGLAPACTL